MPEIPAQQPDTRYQALAKTVVDLIESGALIAGDKAPSLRTLARGQQVSVTTAMAAYRLLESRGILEARPQSGYYVLEPKVSGLAMLPKSPTPKRARRVTITSQVTELLELAGDYSLVPLACAIPGPDLLSSTKLDRSLARLAKTRGFQLNTYGSPRGEESLRRALSTRMLGYGCAISPEDIVTTCGCTEALNLALRAVTRPGDTVAVESPTYFGILQVLQSLGLKALELATDPVSGVDVDSLERALARDSVDACLLSSSFSNPLGSLMPESAKRRTLELLSRFRIPLIEDDIYGDLWFGTERPRPLLALDSRVQGMYCSSFSKTLAPGYRVGWVAGPRYIRQLVENRATTSLCGPAMPQLAIAEYLTGNTYDRHLRRLRKIFASNIQRLSSVVKCCFPADTRISRPAGGFVLWLQLPGRIDTRQLYNLALSEGICFAPGEVFTAGNGYRDCLRLSAGNSWDQQIEEGVARLGELAKSMVAGTR